jgi:hypothetical protein
MGWEAAFFATPLPKDAPDAMVIARVQIRQTAITSLLITIVTGYCIPAPASSVLALPHALFLIAPYVVSYCGLLVFRFDATLNVNAIQWGCNAMGVVGVLATLAYVVNIVFSSIEVSKCESAFCTTNGVGYLVAEIIANCLFFVLFIWLLVWTYLFARDWKTHGKRALLRYRTTEGTTPAPTQARIIASSMLKR